LPDAHEISKHNCGRTIQITGAAGRMSLSEASRPSCSMVLIAGLRFNYFIQAWSGSLIDMTYATFPDAKYASGEGRGYGR
jgi:hypothetical protein